MHKEAGEKLGLEDVPNDGREMIGLGAISLLCLLDNLFWIVLYWDSPSTFTELQSSLFPGFPFVAKLGAISVRFPWAIFKCTLKIQILDGIM